MKRFKLAALIISITYTIGFSQDSTSVQNNTTIQSTTTTTTTSQTSTSTSAREFVAFKVSVGAGYAVPGEGDGAGGGVLFFLEPGYRASDKVLIGLRLETAAIARGVSGVGNNDIKGDATTNLSYTLNGQFYFNNNNVRPFIGAGVGLFSLAAMKFNTANTNNTGTNDIGAETVFGFYPRIGLDAGHFNLTLDYNFIPKSDVPGGGEVINNYLGIRTGISIGGGRLNKNKM
jgi:outer membrane protein W